MSTRAHVLALLAYSLAGCGPSPVAHDPPPAEPHTSSLRFRGAPVVAFTDVVRCVDGVSAERSSSPTSLYCTVETTVDGIESSVDLLLELGSAGGSPAGTELSTLSDITLVRAGASQNGAGLGAERSSWDGAVTLTLGEAGSPRTAVLDGAFSMVTDSSLAMTFNAAPVQIE